MKIIYSPNSSETNKYIELMKTATKQIKSEVIFYSLRDGIKLKNFYKINYICLNWFESFNSQDNFKFYLSFLKKMIILNYFKLFKKKIIFVFHNKISHETKNKKLSLYFIKKLLLNSDKIIIHCRESEEILKSYVKFQNIESKINYVPHPNYIDAYPNTEIEKKVNQLKFLFIGNIREYKNIELLIDIFNVISSENVLLEIAGNPSSEIYKKNLLSRINSKNIKTDFRFIPDEEIIKKLQENDAVILPYHLESSLNSGAVILAFSNKKTIVSSDIPMLKDIKNQDCLYKYSYSSKEEEKIELLNQINKVILDFNKDKDSLKIKGIKLYEEMLETYSIKKVSKHLEKVYQ